MTSTTTKIAIVISMAVAVFALAAPCAGSATKQDSLVVRVDGGFHWADAAIGAAAGFGTAITLVGGIALVGQRNRAVTRLLLERDEGP